MKIGKIQEPKYKCSDCDYGTNKVNHYKRHLKTHTGEKNLPCGYAGCSYMSHRKDSVAGHRRLCRFKPGNDVSINVYIYIYII